MRPCFVALVEVLLSLFGCGDPNKPIKTRAGNLTQDRVEALVRHCGGPSGMVKITDGTMIIKPASDITITGCVLKSLQATGETNLPSFGNEMHLAP